MSGHDSLMDKQVSAVFSQLVVALHRESEYLNGTRYIANAWMPEVKRAISSNVSFFNKVKWAKDDKGCVRWQRVPRTELFDWAD